MVASGHDCLPSGCHFGRNEPHDRGGRHGRPDQGSLELVGAQLTFRRSNFELSLFGRNLMNRISRTVLERDVSLDVPDRLRYAINVPRTLGISFSYRQ